MLRPGHTERDLFGTLLGRRNVGCCVVVFYEWFGGDCSLDGAAATTATAVAADLGRGGFVSPFVERLTHSLTRSRTRMHHACESLVYPMML